MCPSLTGAPANPLAIRNQSPSGADQIAGVGLGSGRGVFVAAWRAGWVGGRLEGSVLWWIDINTEAALYAGDRTERGCRWSRCVAYLAGTSSGV